MNANNSSNTQIRKLIEDWAEAVRNKDLNGILAHHSKDVVMYDLPFPLLQAIGIEAYRETWDQFFSWSRDTGVFDIEKLDIIAGEDVAFCMAIMRCAGYTDGKKENLQFRLTIGLVKEDGSWTIMHEHHSLPNK
jgi:uncharacterized protein (TIGR02246 family)